MTSCGIVVNSCRFSCFCKNDNTEFDWLIDCLVFYITLAVFQLYIYIWTLRYKKYSYEHTYWNGESASWVCCSWWEAVLGSRTDTTRSSPECPCDLQGHEMKHVNWFVFSCYNSQPSIFPSVYSPSSVGLMAKIKEGK